MDHLWPCSKCPFATSAVLLGGWWISGRRVVAEHEWKFHGIQIPHELRKKKKREWEGDE